MNISKHNSRINFINNVAKSALYTCGTVFLLYPMSPPRITDTEADTFQKNTELVVPQNKSGIDTTEINTKRKMCEELIADAKLLGFRTDGIRDLNYITNIEELNEIRDTLSKQINIRKDLIKKGENLKKNNSLEALKKQYLSETCHILGSFDENGSCVYTVISGIKEDQIIKQVIENDENKDYQIIKRVIENNDYIAVKHYKNNLITKMELAERTNAADSATFIMNTEINCKYDNDGNIIENSVKTYYPYQWYIREKTDDLCQTPSLLLDTKIFTNKNSRVKNKHYTGDLFDVEFNGYRAMITNKTKNQTFVLDVNRLLDNKYNNEEQKQELLCTIKSLPGEVLADLAVECCMIGYLDKVIDRDNSGRMLEAGFSVNTYSAMVVRPKDGIITHEIGHLLYEIMTTDQRWNDKFKDVFQKEQKKYINGLKPEDYNLRHYCSDNIHEFFAEAYTYLMLGYTFHEPDDVIVKDFSNSFKMVKDRITEIRKMDLGIRNNVRYEYKSEKDIVKIIMEKRDKYFWQIINFFTGLFGTETDNGTGEYKKQLYKLIDNHINND